MEGYAMGQPADQTPSRPDALAGVDPPARIDALERLLSRTRHDIRSALAPAMLAADMIGTHPDPKVQRASDTMVRAIERVLQMLEATRDIAPPRPAVDRPPEGPGRD